MSKCSKCKRKIPEELLAPIMITDGIVGGVCGVCALAISNEALGCNRKKFDGDIAESMRLDAIAHYKKTKQL